MKRIILLSFFSVIYFLAHSQTVVSQTVRSMPLDTNVIVYDESGNALRFYQYIKLVNTGEYTITSKGEPGTKAVSYLKKIDPQKSAQLYAFIKARLVITSPLLQEGKILDILPLLDIFKTEDLDNKAIVLLFWNTNCPPCTDSFSSLNDYFKDISDRKDIIVIALTGDSEEAAAIQLERTPLLFVKIKNNVQHIINFYQLASCPSYVVADKNHLITYAISGQAPMSIAMFKNSINQVLK